MSKILFVVIWMGCFTGLPVNGQQDQNNDFFDNDPTFDLGGPSIIEVTGEVAEIIRIDLTGLPKRSIVVKETRLAGNEVEFIGAYRYDGVSLYDILRSVPVKKRNAAEFNPVIDQYVVVYGAKGDSVVFSWGEIFYPVNIHQILVATKVMRIVPSKTLDQWPLPDRKKIIAGHDLFTERNIAEPVKIAIRSIRVSYKVDRSVKLWAPEMTISGFGEKPVVMTSLPASLPVEEIGQVFYGRGSGIHGITKFRGVWMKDLLPPLTPITPQRIRTGLFVIAAVDGYRCAMTYSELMNRNDNAGVLIMDENTYERAGRFSCLFAADFFSDRAIKSITEIRLIQ